MTCIVGYTDDATVWLAGDSCAADVGQWTKHVAFSPKKVRSFGFRLYSREARAVIGYTSSFRMADILWSLIDRAHRFNPASDDAFPAVTSWYGATISMTGVDLERHWVVNCFIPVIQQAFSEAGWQKVEHERRQGGDFLLGFEGRLFRIQEDYSVVEASEGYDAVGCGDKFAIGAMYVSNGLEPEVRLKNALAAAEHHSAYVSQPFHVVSTGGAT